MKDKYSSLFKEGSLIFLVTLFTRGILFFANTYAAKCLGPFNLGVSAQIQTLSQQVALAYNCGLDIVGARWIAEKPRKLSVILLAIILIRTTLAGIAVIIWMFVVYYSIPSGVLRNAWILGGVLIFTGSISTNFAYLGLSRLLLYSGITAIISIITSCLYFIYFHEGMQLGADLWVILISNLLLGILGLIFINFIKDNKLELTSIKLRRVLKIGRYLIYSGKKLWILAIFSFLYSSFPILIIGYSLGNSEAGIYRIAFLMAGVLEMFFSSFNSLLIPRFIKHKNESLQGLWINQIKLTKYYIVISIFIVMASVFLAPIVISEFVGSEFQNSLDIFYILAIGRAIVFVGQIFAFAVMALKMDNVLMLVSLAGAIFSVAINLIFIDKYGILGVAVVSVVSELLISLLYFYFEKNYIIKSNFGRKID